MRRLESWQVLDSEYLLQKRWLNVRRDRVKTGGDVTIDEFYVLEVPSWSCVVCVSAKGELILTRQYRHGAGRVTLELPAGVIEPDETPQAAARRELFEETGYTSDNWVELATLTPEPARHTHLAHCFVALGAEPTHEQSLDDGEDVVVEVVPRARARELVETGEIVHAVHVAAVLLALQRGLLE